MFALPLATPSASGEAKPFDKLLENMLGLALRSDVM
jgi:hypothetical protein